MPKLETFKKDPIGSVTWTLDQYILSLSRILSTFHCSFLAKMWGIQLGSGSRFYGVTHFSRYPCSQITIGKNCTFRSSFRSNFVGLNRACGISTDNKKAKIDLGDNCGFSGVIIGAAKSIVLGNHVLCGANVTITDFDWHSTNPNERGQSGFDQAKPVRIGNNVWLGLNTLVLKGVEIGDNTVVGANSVVTSSLPENVLAAGVPARVLRSLL